MKSILTIFFILYLSVVFHLSLNLNKNSFVKLNKNDNTLNNNINSNLIKHNENNFSIKLIKIDTNPSIFLFLKQIQNDLKNNKNASFVIQNNLDNKSSNNLYENKSSSLFESISRYFDKEFIQKSFLSSYSNNQSTNDSNSTNNNNSDIEKNKAKQIPIKLKNYKNSQYVGIVKIGTPYQLIPVIFDTGSGNLWVTSELCKSKYCLTNKSRYNRDLSSTYVEGEYDIEVQFGSGSVQGQINKETIELGEIQIKNQSFGEIMLEDGDVFSGNFSGILGLGYPGLSNIDSPAPMDNIISESLLDKNIITFFYSYNEKSYGEIDFGFINKEKYTGEIKYYNVVEKYYWTIELVDIKLGDKSLNLCSNGCKAVIDTGTTLISGPSDDIPQLLDKLNIKENCEGYDNLEDLVFVFRNTNNKQLEEYKIDKKSYISNNKNDLSQCSSLIIPLDIPSDDNTKPYWILGDTFMQNYLTVFDRDNNTVGFAKAKHVESRVEIGR